jgi:hypothetical protein
MFVFGCRFAVDSLITQQKVICFRERWEELDRDSDSVALRALKPAKFQFQISNFSFSFHISSFFILQFCLQPVV